MLERGGFDGLLLDFPREFQALIDALTEGVSLVDVEGKIDDELGQLSEGWLYRNRGILESISRSLVAPGPACIGELEVEKRILEGKMTISLLEYRGMAGHIDVHSWRELLGRIADGSTRSVERQMDRALALMGGGGRWLWISDIHARRAAPVLRGEGHSCHLVLLGRPYLGTPLEALRAELAERSPTDSRVLYLVERHVEFLRDYVLVSSNLDEAYDGWLAAEEWLKLYHLQGAA